MSCPNCPPGYDCESGNYFYALPPEAPSGFVRDRDGNLWTKTANEGYPWRGLGGVNTSWSALLERGPLTEVDGGAS